MYNSSGVAEYRYKYFYDNSGNLVNWYINNNDNTETYENHTYTYGNTSWADLLTAFDGYGIAYEGQTYNYSTGTVSGTAKSGNPICYYNGTRWDFTWTDGRRLASADNENAHIVYTYDLNGIRTSKTVGTKTYSYLYASGKLLQQTDGTNTWNFAYAANGNPFSLTYNGTTYYYITNQMGDVMYLVNASGTRVAAYTYDPYGKVLTATGTMASINPLRYRGYYYDTETGFYYLQSRYYDPLICRFINADSYASTGDGLLGYNIFAYCNNDPVNYLDCTGIMATSATVAVTNFWNPLGWTAAAILLVEIVVVVVVIADSDNHSTTSDHLEYSSTCIETTDSVTLKNKKGNGKTKSKQPSITAGETTSPKPPRKNGRNSNQNPEFKGGVLYNKDGVRVDYEYNGNGTGNVHIQTSSGKFYFDSANNVLRVGLNNSSPLAPNVIQNLLNNAEIYSALLKGIRFIGLLGGWF